MKNIFQQNVSEEIIQRINQLTPGSQRQWGKMSVVSETPYKKNGRTAPQFIINGSRDFNAEKTKLVENIRKAQELGQQYFDGKENISFGKMTATEWNNMFYKHLDHHLKQFGV